jgi:hypothetical protein
LPYPTTALRGLRTSSHVTEKGRVKLDAYLPPKSSNLARKKRAFTPHTDCHEVSINWFDHVGALVALAATKNSAGGVLEIPAICIENCVALFGGNLFVERRPDDDNRFHGNILYHEKASDTQIESMAQVLAGFSAPITDVATRIVSETASLRERVQRDAYNRSQSVAGEPLDHWLAARRGLGVEDTELPDL